MNAASLFHAAERRNPTALALRWDDGTMSYGELGDASRRFGSVLATLGVRTDERVAILLPNHPAFAVALLGTFWHGSAAAVLSPAWRATDADRALANADARVLVTTSAVAATLERCPPTVLVVDDDDDARSFAGACARQPAGLAGPPAPRTATEPATILYSSGTTGDPKGVVLSHGNLVFNAESKVRYCEIQPDDALALVVPISHCFGQNVVLLGALAAGASVRIYARFHAGQVHAGIRAGEVTHLYAAPLVFQRLLDAGATEWLRTLRVALSAAAPLPPTLASQWRAATAKPLRQGYGLTESSPFATYDDGRDGLTGCVGAAIDGVEIRIGEVEGDAWLGEDVLGEVAIRGPNVMTGYWRRPDETARALRGGWLRTGDVGRLTANGALYLTDRLDDAINVAGFKVYPSDVERAIASHAAVADVVAYRVAGDGRGSKVALDVVLAPGATITAEEVHAHATIALARFQRPSFVRIVSSLPRSPSGKVLRRVLTASFQPAASSR
ncbi:MAG: acyl--CoA ligase [Gemmatimonadaceae bacterium]|nr:acyl--CoA ligase [Gemmatimonadaceae bacterium]